MEGPPTAEGLVRRGPEHQVVVALGSNLGDRLEHLAFGVRRLEEEGFGLDALSSVFETPAVGYLDQPDFLNMVTVGRTSLAPGGLLALLQSIEEDAGRKRAFNNAPRTLDLDLVFFKGRIVREPGLTVPHPRWKERSFVVRPLQSLCADLVDPETGLRVDEVWRIWPQEPERIREVLRGPEFPRRGGLKEEP
jgi:2-amino-4-hydroxy-6-hydroxymethyldihydropteridine diphosphokinase